VPAFSIFRDAVRAKQIVAILLKYRFDEILGKIDTPAAWITKITPAVSGHHTLWQRVRLAIEELGPTFVKAGQLLSTRPDILPRELIVELHELRNKVKAVPFADIRPLLEKELGGALENFFEGFDETPVAAGSVGQVYRANLKGDMRPVIIKIQRPNIRKNVLTDLEMIQWFADQLHENIAGLRPFDLPTVVEELRQGLLNELDFTIEARNAELFNSLNQFPEQVFAPAVIERFTTERLIVTDYIAGAPPDDRTLDKTHAAELAQTGGNSFFSQIAVTGFFHGDPHPGNLLITPDRRICFIDWGLAGQLTQRMRFHLIDLFSACNERNAEKVARIAMRMGASSRRVDQVRLEKAVTTVLFKFDDDLREMDNLGHLIFELIFVFGSNGIHIARDYTLLAKAVISIEETAHALDPDFNLAAVGNPYVRRMTWERWNPVNLARSGIDLTRERVGTLMELPLDVQRVLHRLEDQDIGILLEHRGFANVGETIHHAFSRLALAVIIGSLIIGSSFVINTGVEPLLWGYPAIGILGYILSVFMGIYIAFDILRSHKIKEPRRKRKRR
jgi:ubiquinone biosynthesis protein